MAPKCIWNPGRKFHVHLDVWDAWTPDQQWAFNKEFLDEAIAANERIWLTTAPEKVPAGFTLEKELKYLSSQPWLVAKAGRRSLGGCTVLEK